MKLKISNTLNYIFFGKCVTGILMLLRRAGLPISKKIAGRHEEIIRTRSEEEGNGSTFILKISSTKSEYRHRATINMGMEKGSKFITLV